MSAQNTVYRVRNWDQQFETRGSSPHHRPRAKIAINTSLDSLILRRLLTDPQGATAYGVWILLLQIAAKTPVRGTLADQSGAYTAADLSLLTSIPECQILSSLEILCSPQIALLESVPTDATELPSGESEIETNNVHASPGPSATPTDSAPPQTSSPGPTKPEPLPSPAASVETSPETPLAAFSTPFATLKPPAVRPPYENLPPRLPNHLPSETFDLPDLQKFQKMMNPPLNKKRRRHPVYKAVGAAHHRAE